MRVLMLSLILGTLAVPAMAQDWRLLANHGDNVGAMDVSSVEGPPERRLFDTAIAPPAGMQGVRYIVMTSAIDCSTGVVRAVEGEMFGPAGSMGRRDMSAFPPHTLNEQDGTARAASLVCEDKPLDTQRFATIDEFLIWVDERGR